MKYDRADSGSSASLIYSLAPRESISGEKHDFPQISQLLVFSPSSMCDENMQKKRKNDQSSELKKTFLPKNLKIFDVLKNCERTTDHLRH